MVTLIGKSITRNWMTGTEQTDQISFPATEIEGAVKYPMGIANPFRTDAENRTEPAIKPTIVHSYQATVPVHSNQNHPPLESLDSGTDVPRSGRNIDKHNRMNP